MAGLPIPVMPTWHAMPPEINTSRLMVGAGSAPMLQAAAGWEALALSLETQADELSASLAQLSATWTGAASEQAIQAATPMIMWLRTTSLQAHKRALQAAAQAGAHTTALAETPPIPEIEENHITHAVLEATNFLGVNAVPIGINEEDYFVRMWNEAAAAMDGYHAETLVNTTFEPIAPMPPIVVPGVGEAAGAVGMAEAAALAPGAAIREATFAQVTAQATAESTVLQAGRVGSVTNQAATAGENKVQRAGETAEDRAGQQPQDQFGQQSMQMMSQMASQVTQMPQQAGQMLQSPMQQLTQPLQQVSQLFSQFGNGGGPDGLSGTSLSGGAGRGAQIGMIGAHPFSSHPLAGGGGPSVGAGMVRAASLPGAGGMGARTPMLAGLLGESALLPSAVDARPGPGTTAAGLAPVAAGAGGGGGAPMGGMGHRGTSGGVRQGLGGPEALDYENEEDDTDDW